MSELVLTNVGVEIDGRWLVRGANVSLKAGCLTAFVGPNGSGKTTLLRVMAGLLDPSEGEARLNNANLQSYSRRELARHISFVPQDTHVSFAFTVKEVVAMGRHPHLSKFQREGAKDQEAVNAALERADVVHLADRYVTELSGGERQRIIIARSLATESDIMLLDEPTANLDIAHSLDVLELCRKLVHEGKAICIALHDINAAARYADEIVLMNAGRVFKQGSPQEVFQAESLNEVFEVCTDRTQTADGKSVFVFYRDVQ
jgi:iron complex transport system ATP-binding protein